MKDALFSLRDDVLRVATLILTASLAEAAAIGAFLDKRQPIWRGR